MATSQRLPEIVQSLRDKGNTNATINRKISFLRRLMVGALKAGYISWLPQAGRLGETANLPQVLSREQTSSLFSLLAQRSPDFAKFAEFLLDTGAHVGEALRLSWTDITHKRVTFWDTDRKRHRSVALTDRAYEAVRFQNDSPQGPFQGINLKKFRKALASAANECGCLPLNVTPLTLRYTCEARLVEAGIDMLTIQKWFGHRTPRTALRHEASMSLEDALDILERPKS
ncbi:tyrosine-type recombinase/integrase [Aminobacter aminovorans]|uniref:tyrosine-type recombinase/integrase n=1 Tax=Aminobacter aminovorans TaxID=83263 RepID=UPI0038D383A5